MRSTLTLLTAFLIGCSGKRPAPRLMVNPQCSALTKALADQESSFVAHVKQIREQHVLLKDYDRQMIAAITERRAALQATALTELSVNEDISGCSGESLDDLRRRAHEQMLSLGAFLNTFNRALKSDPQDVFIDQP